MKYTMTMETTVKTLKYKNLHFSKIDHTRSDIQLFRERVSEKVHATIPKGIVGGF